MDLAALDELRVPCLAAMRQPLYTYPTEPTALIARLLQDVHLLRVVLAVRTAGDQAVTEALTDGMAVTGLASALARLGGTLTVSRAEFDRLADEGHSIAMRKRADGTAIDFVLTDAGGLPARRTPPPRLRRPRRPRR